MPGYDPIATAPKGSWFDAQAADDACEFIAQLELFEGEVKPFVLEDWQAAIVGCLFGWKRADGTRRYRKAFVYVPRKNGKMLALDTPIPTPSGWATMGTLRAGDTIFDDNGLPCTVQQVHPIDYTPESFEIKFSNGEAVKACADHLWVTTARVDKPGDKSSGRTKRPLTRVRTTREIYETQRYGKRQDRNHSVALPAPLQLPPVELPVDPYLLGCWLGDGDSDGSRLTCAESDIPHFMSALGEAGCCLVRHKSTGRSPRLHMRSRDTGVGYVAELRAMEVFGNKHIPPQYLRASYSQRLALLQGLMDTDGTADKRNPTAEFTTTREQLARDVCELLATLGLKYGCRKLEATLNGEGVGPKWRIWFTAYRDETPVFRMARKLERMPLSTDSGIAGRSRTVQIVSVEPCEPVPMRCITVDSPSSLYLCGNTMLPTHNTPLMAAIVLLCMLCDGEPGAQLYSAAADKDQAALLFRHAAEMAERNEQLAPLVKVYRTYKSIEFPAAGGVYKSLTSEPGTKHGQNAHVVIVDELHAHPTDELVNVLVTGTASRKHPLVLFITTADFSRKSVCNDEHEYACKVRDQVLDAPAYLPVVYEASLDDDWTDEKVWARVNPNLGVSVSREYLREECQKALDQPSYQNTFMRLHLNVKTQQDVRWLSLEKWDRCTTVQPEQYAAWAKQFEGEPCWLGMDLSSVSDMSCVMQLFDTENGAACVPHFFIPEERMIERSKRDRVPYDAWVRDGWMTATPGGSIQYDFILARIRELNETSDVREINYDGWQAHSTVTELEAEGFACVKMRQGFASLNAPSKELERLIMAGELDHGGHPVLRWCASNVMAETDAAGNVKPSKKKSTEKIDGITALVMSIAGWSVATESGPSIYETPGSMFL